MKIVLILLLAAVLRLVNLNQSLWLDEGAQLLMSSKDFTFQWFGRGADFQPPLFSFITHFWMRLGTVEWFVRLPSVFFGVVTVYFTYLAGKAIFSKKVGLLASLFLAVAPYHIYYSQEVRPYSLLALCATASMYFLYKKNWLAYVLATTALLYSHYTGLFVVLAQGVWVLSWQRKVIKPWVKSFFIAFLLFLPWLPQFIKQFEEGQNLTAILPAWGNVASLPALKVFPITFVKFSLGRVSFNNEMFYLGVSLLIFAIIGLTFYKVVQKTTHKNIFLLNWFFTPVVAVFLISFFVPMYQPFRILFAMIPFCLLLAVGILNFTEKYQKLLIGLVLFINLSGLTIYYSNPQFQREDWRGATQFIEGKDSQNSVALFEFSLPFAPYQWYESGRVDAYGVLPGMKATRDIVNTRLPVVTKGKTNIYLFQYLKELTDPDDLVANWLNDNDFKLRETYDFPGVGFVYNYHKQSLEFKAFN